MSQKRFWSNISVLAIALLNSCNLPVEGNIQKDQNCEGGIPVVFNFGQDYKVWTDGNEWHLDSPSTDFYIKFANLTLQTFTVPPSEVWNESDFPLNTWLRPDGSEPGQVHFLYDNYASNAHIDQSIIIPSHAKNEICASLDVNGNIQIFRKERK